MLRERTKQEIIDWCKKHDVDCINIRSFKQKGKSRIKVTIRCKECGNRSDILKENLMAQKFPGLCTSCAHNNSFSLCLQQSTLHLNLIFYNILFC